MKGWYRSYRKDEVIVAFYWRNWRRRKLLRNMFDYKEELRHRGYHVYWVERINGEDVRVCIGWEHLESRTKRQIRRECLNLLKEYLVDAREYSDSL